MAAGGEVASRLGPDRTGGGGGRPLSGSGRGRSARSTRLLIKWPPLVLLRDPAAVFGGLLMRSGWLAGRPLWSRLLQREGDLWCGGALADHESSTAACCCLSVLVVENERHEDGRSHVSRRTRASRCRGLVWLRGWKKFPGLNLMCLVRTLWKVDPGDGAGAGTHDRTR